VYATDYITYSGEIDCGEIETNLGGIEAGSRCVITGPSAKREYDFVVAFEHLHCVRSRGNSCNLRLTDVTKVPPPSWRLPLDGRNKRKVDQVYEEKLKGLHERQTDRNLSVLENH
jgi:hypothetical protein